MIGREEEEEAPLSSSVSAEVVEEMKRGESEVKNGASAALGSRTAVSDATTGRGEMSLEDGEVTGMNEETKTVEEKALMDKFKIQDKDKNEELLGEMDEQVVEEGDDVKLLNVEGEEKNVLDCINGSEAQQQFGSHGAEQELKIKEEEEKHEDSKLLNYEEKEAMDDDEEEEDKQENKTDFLDKVDKEEEEDDEGEEAMDENEEEERPENNENNTDFTDEEDKEEEEEEREKENITTYKSQKEREPKYIESYIGSYTENGIHYNNNKFLQEHIAIPYNDVVLMGECDIPLRRLPLREMSVIEEEEGEDAEETLMEGVVEYADELAAWVLGEACLEAGRAWEMTTAWEEMTFSELMHRRDKHRHLYKTISMPPENELMKGSERQLSEAELRVRRSLQRLDVPEWMKNAPPPQQGFLLRRRDYGSTTAPSGGGWSAYSSKTASMTSLGSSRAVTPNTPTKVVIPTRVATRGAGGLTSPASNCSISPSPSDRSGSLFQYPISRWSTSRLNSGTTTPTGSVTSSRTTATYGRQPYLGWRSQTSLANLAGSQSSLTSTGSYLTAADRLALGITAYSQRFVKPTPSTQDKENSSSEANAAVPKPENQEQNDTGSTNGNAKLQVPTDVADVHSSIKEVTSAIVHYCNESTPSPRASPRGSPRPDGRAPSPRRLVWVESSFVGSRPITSPETPTSSTHAITPTSQLNGHDLPESGEVTSRPPQPPGEYLLAW